MGVQRFIKVNRERNQRRWYVISWGPTLFGRWAVVRSWGMTIPAHLRRTSEVSAMTGIPTRTLRRWASEGLVEAQKVGPRDWYISVEDAQRVAEITKPGPKPKR